MSPSDVWHYFGASVRGPRHAQVGEPNQDAWSGCRTAYGTLVVVCDGLGSRPNSAAGARAACRAVRDALRFWTAAPDAPTDLLPRLVHLLWTLRVQPVGGTASATTCLFAAALADGRLALAQLGDGMVLLRRPGESAVVLTGDRPGFGNETTGLGVAKAVTEWTVRVESAVPGTAVLLATDGVADDLVPDKLDGFLDHVRSLYGPLAPRRRGAVLARDLRAWPTERHLDDKTLALLWHEPKDGHER